MATKPSERKIQILETLASMLGKPRLEKITTASLAAQLDLSEAALYRHFASKAQMFEGLIDFIEQSLFNLINKITLEELDGFEQVQKITTVLLLFAEKNPGMVRVLIGDALVNENERLQLRINQMFDRIESSIKQSYRIAQAQSGKTEAPDAVANLVLSFVIGRWHQFAKSGFKRSPSEFSQTQLSLLTLRS
jgi:TetR/AcrR family transcriptional regulator